MTPDAGKRVRRPPSPRAITVAEAPGAVGRGDAGRDRRRTPDVVGVAA